LAGYAMTWDAELTPTEIERLLTRELERAIDATEGGEALSPQARALHGLPEPEPVPAYLRGLSREELQRRLDGLPDQWWEAVMAADERAEQRERPDPNAPIAVVRPDL